MVTMSEAKRFVGQVCSVSWRDREGAPVSAESRVHAVTYMPMYGPYLVLDMDDIRLDCVTDLRPMSEIRSAERPEASGVSDVRVAV